MIVLTAGMSPPHRGLNPHRGNGISSRPGRPDHTLDVAGGRPLLSVSRTAPYCSIRLVRPVLRTHVASQVCDEARWAVAGECPSGLNLNGVYRLRFET
jgi:hypothetical protein